MAKRLVREASKEAAEKLREDIRNKILERDRTARLRCRGFNAMNGTADPRPRQRDLQRRGGLDALDGIGDPKPKHRDPREPRVQAKLPNYYYN